MTKTVTHSPQLLEAQKQLELKRTIFKQSKICPPFGLLPIQPNLVGYPFLVTFGPSAKLGPNVTKGDMC